MHIHYTVFDPTKNITALVTSPVPRAQYAAAAAALMRLRPQIEQVGFLEQPESPDARLRLQMMGGEFCGNATMSTAAYLAQQEQLPDRGVTEYPLEVSGADRLLSCRIERSGDHFFGTVAMPLPRRIFTVPLSIQGVCRSVPAVELPGIVHCIVPAELISRETAETEFLPRFPQLCRQLRTDACGILLFQPEEAAFTPLVYVASTQTAVWESGCGSGSAALASWLASQVPGEPEREAALHQPGGVIRVHTRMQDGRITHLDITGEVRPLGTGTADLAVEAPSI